jgi:hypothetical protein
MKLSLKDDFTEEQTMFERILSAFRTREDMLVSNWAFVGSAMVDGEESFHGDAVARPEEDLSAVREAAIAVSEVNMATRALSGDADAREQAVREYSRIIGQMLSKKGIMVDEPGDQQSSS